MKSILALILVFTTIYLISTYSKPLLSNQQIDKVVDGLKADYVHQFANVGLRTSKIDLNIDKPIDKYEAITTKYDALIHHLTNNETEIFKERLEPSLPSVSSFKQSYYIFLNSLSNTDLEQWPMELLVQLEEDWLDLEASFAINEVKNILNHSSKTKIRSGFIQRQLMSIPPNKQLFDFEEVTLTIGNQ